MADVKKRDRDISRAVHRLFWEANFQRKNLLFIAYIVRFTGSVLLNAVAPLFAALGVQAILEGNTQTVYFYAAMIVVVTAAYLLLSLIGSITVSKNAISGSYYLTNKIFTNFLNKDYEFYTNRFSGALGEQISRIRAAYTDYGEVMTGIIPSNIATIGGSLVILAFFSLELAFVTFIAMGLIIASSLGVSRYRQRYRGSVSEASSQIAGQVGDALTHGSTVKSFASDEEELRRLQAPLRVWGKRVYRLWMSFEQFNATRAMLTALSVSGLLIASLWLYSDGKISTAIVVLVQVYVIRLVMQTVMLGDLVKRFEQIMTDAHDPVATLMIKPTVVDPKTPQELPKKPLELALHKVNFHYDEARRERDALQDLTLSIKPGQKIGIVGHSGSGKTTLTKLLLRFMDVTSGSITLGGIDIRDIRQKDLRRTISYVPQEPLLFHRSIIENIRYGRPDASDEEIKKAASRAYLDEFIDELPQGYNTLVGERGVKLSGGQRQRVAVARALLKDAPILVLDEATSALDSKSEKYIQDALWKLMKNRTAIVIAHRLSTIQHMDTIIVLDKGKIVQSGTHDELRRQPGIYAELWSHQSGGYIGLPDKNDDDESNN